MKITNMRWVKGKDRPELAVDIDGEETIIPAEQKPTLILNGYVFLGSDFEDKFPELSFAKLTLRGFVKDADLVQEYVRLMRG